MVLDSKALLILLRGEPGVDRVARALEEPCCITAVSLAALLAELPGILPRALLDDLERISVEVVAVDSSLSVDATKVLSSGAKLEPALTLTLARQRGLEVLVGERGVIGPSDWKVKVNVVR